MPAITLVMATYNRAHTLRRAIDSVLAQTFIDWGLVVVDDGSTDGSAAVLAGYTDPRIRVVTHPANRGVLAAKNTGFDHADSPWLTTHDSDDELTPDALAALFAEVARDGSLEVLGCNCADAATGARTASGLDGDVTLTYRDYRARVRGETWGMMRRDRLGARRFNERIHGMEGVLWLALLDGARCRYIDRVLRIYHTDGADRLSVVARTSRAREERLYRSYAAIVDEEGEFLQTLREVDAKGYADMVADAAMQFVLEGDRAHFDVAAARLDACGEGRRALGLRLAWRAGPVARAGRAAMLAWYERGTR